MKDNVAVSNLNEKILYEFSDFMKYDKKMKENTVLSYERDISSFLSFCESNDVIVITETVALFEKYIEFLRNVGKSPSTISRNIASLRSLFRFMRDNGYTKVNPTSGMKYEKKGIIEISEVHEILTTDEVDKLISSARGDSLKAVRDEAILETLYACGLKVSELINLKTEHLFLNEGYITVVNGKTSRYVPIYKGAVKILRNYISNVRTQITKDRRNTWVFLNRDAKPLTRQGLWKILKVYGEKAGIEKEITPHIIRKSMAVHLLENGASLFDVKDILGHKNINLTKEYIKEFKPSVISAYSKAHPRA